MQNRRRRPGGRTGRTVHPRKEAPIRALSVSLLAVAAIAASLVLTRNRQEREPSGELVPAGEDMTAGQPLDAIRAAGL